MQGVYCPAAHPEIGAGHEAAKIFASADGVVPGRRARFRHTGDLQRLRDGAGTGPYRLRERMMAVAHRIWYPAVRPRERMNSPLERRKVRLRGLGGPGVCGAPRGYAPQPVFLSHRCVSALVVAFRARGYSPRRRTSRTSSGEFIRSRRGLGGPGVCGAPRGCASAAGVLQPSVRFGARRSAPRSRLQSAQADFANFQRRIHSRQVPKICHAVESACPATT